MKLIQAIIRPERLEAVQQALLGRLNLPIGVLERLVVSPVVSVRRVLAANPRLHEVLRRVLLGDPDDEVRRLAAKR